MEKCGVKIYKNINNKYKENSQKYQMYYTRGLIILIKEYNYRIQIQKNTIYNTIESIPEQ